MVAEFPPPYRNYQIIILIIWFDDTVTVLHLTKSNTNSKVGAILFNFDILCFKNKINSIFAYFFSSAGLKNCTESRKVYKSCNLQVS